VATIKLDWTPNVAINNYEYGYPDTVQHYPWQSDKTMGADWLWIRNASAKYMSARQRQFFGHNNPLRIRN
jgi:hypothetical protein